MVCILDIGNNAERKEAVLGHCKICPKSISAPPKSIFGYLVVLQVGLLMLVDNEKKSWAPTRKHFVPSHPDKNSVARFGLSGPIYQDQTLIAGDRGRVHYPPRASDTEKFIPLKKQLQAPRNSAELDSAQGRKYIREPELPNKRPPEAIHFRGRSGYDIPEATLNMGRKTTVKSVTGGSRARLPAEEKPLEDKMGRKRRVLTAVEQCNGLESAKPGDKSYCTPEFSDRFYKNEGGVIPGSCISDRRRRGSALASTLSGGKKTLQPGGDTDTYSQLSMGQQQGLNYRPRMSYQAKRRAQMLMGDVESVAVLTSTRGAGNNVEPSWEDKTGRVTWVTRPQRAAAEAAAAEAAAAAAAAANTKDKK